jgi:ssDNA thymidine ADP-ribosyltransferase, DarT
MATLGPEANRIFRITHVDNVPWILEHGLHCESSMVRDPNFVPIGMANLIQKRQTRPVAIGPGGLLSDYVPFYFTPSSIMLLNVKTGYNDVIKRPNDEIVILVSSLERLTEHGTRFVFTNGHAYLAHVVLLTCSDSHRAICSTPTWMPS